MTKARQTNLTFRPLNCVNVAPEADRNDETFQQDIEAWFTHRLARYTLNGPRFVNWIKEIIKLADGSLKHLFYRYGIPPSVILDIIAASKQVFLTQEQVEAGDWITDVPEWFVTQARLGLPDSEMEKMLRNKKLRERNAQALEKAVRVLLKYPRYLEAVPDMLDPLRLPERLNSIAKHIRSNVVQCNHRPHAEAASTVISRLTMLFQELTGNPLYEYAGRLTKTCFPEEWNPAGDVREAAKKLIKSRRTRAGK